VRAKRGSELPESAHEWIRAPHREGARARGRSQRIRREYARAADSGAPRGSARARNREVRRKGARARANAAGQEGALACGTDGGHGGSMRALQTAANRTGAHAHGRLQDAARERASTALRRRWQGRLKAADFSRYPAQSDTCGGSAAGNHAAGDEPTTGRRHSGRGGLAAVRAARATGRPHMSPPKPSSSRALTRSRRF